MLRTRCYQSDFPVFSTNSSNLLCYFDSAATCLIPELVTDKIHQANAYFHANSHRGLYGLSANATEIIEQVRHSVTEFFQANSADEIIFIPSATYGINQIARGFVEPNLSSEKNIVISVAEHHANLLPWQALCQQSGAELRIANLNEDGTIDPQHLYTLLDSSTAIIAINHVSNVLGVENDIKSICQFAHSKNIPVFVDGAQAVGHLPVNLIELGCDFYVCSGHKMYAGAGCGILYSKIKHIDNIVPVILGGGIVEQVSFEQTQFSSGREKLEAGTLNLSAIVGLGAAIDYLSSIGWHNINAHLNLLASQLADKLSMLAFIEPLIPFEYLSSDCKGKASKKPTIFSFNVDRVHCHDVASFLDNGAAVNCSIAVRAGHHCAQPLHRYFGLNASVRVSLGLYNNEQDIEQLATALSKCHQYLSLES